MNPYSGYGEFGYSYGPGSPYEPGPRLVASTPSIYPTAFGDAGDLGCGGDCASCPAMQGWGSATTRCSKLRARYKQKKAQFEKRGRRFLGIKTGDGSKKLDALKRKIDKACAKAKTQKAAIPDLEALEMDSSLNLTDDPALQAQDAAMAPSGMDAMVEGGGASAGGGLPSWAPYAIGGGLLLVLVAVFASGNRQAAAPAPVSYAGMGPARASA